MKIQFLGCGLRRALAVVMVTALGLSSQMAFARSPAATTGTSATPSTETPASLAARIAPEVFFAHPGIIEAVLSPSGKLLAVTSKRGDDSAARASLFVLNLDAPGKPIPVAAIKDVDIQGVRWINESRLAFQTVDSLAPSGRRDDVGGPGLFAVNPDGTGMVVLIARGLARANDATNAMQGALPDHSYGLLMVPKAREGKPNDSVVVGQVRRNAMGKPNRVVPYWLNVNTGAMQIMETNAPHSTIAWRFDRSGEPRIAMTRDGKDYSIFWRAPAQTEWKLLVQADYLNLPFVPHSVGDSGQLYVTHPDGPDRIDVLSTFDFTANAPSAKPLVRAAGFDFRGGLIPGDFGEPIKGVRVNADAEGTVWFDAAMQKMQTLADAHLPGRVNNLICGRCGAQETTVLVRSYSDKQPGELWLYRKADAKWQLLFGARRGIDERLMASVNLHRIKARDGRDLPVWVTRPIGMGDAVDASSKPMVGPAVVMIHGGPWVRDGFWRWQAMEQFLASRGYTIISPEFRGSAGYGQVHEQAGYKQWGQAMQSDVADALAWAQKAGLVNDRACVMGASYGGYASLMELARHGNLYRCGISYAAVTDLDLYASGSWRVDDDIDDFGRRYTIPEMVGDPKLDADMLRANSPIHVADKIKAPVLLAFGEADRRVPLAHGTRMREALIKAGNTPLWVTYPGEGHGGWLPKTNVDFAKRVEEFLGQHLK